MNACCVKQQRRTSQGSPLNTNCQRPEKGPRSTPTSFPEYLVPPGSLLFKQSCYPHARFSLGQNCQRLEKEKENPKSTKKTKQNKTKQNLTAPKVASVVARSPAHLAPPGSPQSKQPYQLHTKSPLGQDYKRLEKPLLVPYLLHPRLLSLLHTLGYQGPCDSSSCAISMHGSHWGRSKSFTSASGVSSCG